MTVKAKKKGPLTADKAKKKRKRKKKQKKRWNGIKIQA